MRDAAKDRAYQERDVEGQTLQLGGSYMVRDREVTLTVNGDPIMRGKFAPYTPTLNLKGNYKNIPVTAVCRFGSILSSHGGTVGTVASMIQAGTGKGNDICEVRVPGKPAETLYF